MLSVNLRQGVKEDRSSGFGQLQPGKKLKAQVCMCCFLKRLFLWVEKHRGIYTGREWNQRFP